MHACCLGEFYKEAHFVYTFEYSFSFLFRCLEVSTSSLHMFIIIF